MRALFLSFLLVLLWPLHVYAGPGGQNCDKARSSADVMSCLNAKYEAAQEELNKAFDALSMQNSDEALIEIKDIQARWLEYRTLECAQETAALETESLKRLEGLRCMNRITRERVGAIKNSLKHGEDEVLVGEAALAQPRWMNALAEDFPDTFWRYGGRIEGDLDCDGDIEQVMTGLQVSPDTGLSMPIISVSENPSTGRPASAVVALTPTPPGEGEDTSVPCGFLTDIQYIQKAQEEADQTAEASEAAEVVEAAEEVEMCQNHLIVSAQNCRDMKLSWDGQAYVFGK